MKKRVILLWAVVIAGFGVQGCNLLVPFIFVGEHKKKIMAEFDKLPQTRTAILVWTDQETRYDYPWIRLELASYIASELSAELNKGNSHIDIVDPRDVSDFLQTDMSAGIDPVKVGRKYNADYVIFVQLLEFQIRDPASPQLVQGKINAAVSVHDVRADPDQTVRYELAPVETAVPKTPVLLTPTNSARVREQLYRSFSEQVARKFYDYTVDL